MSTAGKLAGFAVLLAAVFALAALAGAAIEPGTIGGDEPTPHASDQMDAGEQAQGGDEAGHGAEQGAAVQALPGLAVSEAGLTLELAERSLPRGRAARLRFRISGPDGRAWTRFDVAHDKRMHLIVVRRDGRGFQHLHPAMAADGTWVTPIRLDEAGVYRVFADFTRSGRKSTLGADLTVPGSAAYQDFPAPAARARTGDGRYEVRLAPGRPTAGQPAELRFAVTRNGAAVETEPYLGAGGHLVALRQGDLAYLHTHPAGGEEDAHAPDAEPATDPAEHEGEVAFESTFPTAGAYRLYFQFKHAGRVRTAEFTQEVTR
jgi:hypothetical protein